MTLRRRTPRPGHAPAITHTLTSSPVPPTSQRDRCPRYWPTKEEGQAHFGPITVECLREDKKKSYNMAVLRSVALPCHMPLRRSLFGAPCQRPVSVAASRAFLPYPSMTVKGENHEHIFMHFTFA